MDLGIEYDVNELPEASGFEPLPAGDYRARVDGAEVRPTKSGGEMLAIKWGIIGPSHEGRVVFGHINLRNSNEKAQEIGRQQLGELMRAVGLSRLRDTDELVGSECVIRVKVRPASDGYDASNDIKGFRAVEGAAPKAAGKPAASGGKPPWAK